MADRVRLDALMVERGLFPTRSRAAAAVMAGEVAVGAQRTRVSKPGTQVSPDVDIAVAEAPRYVSRGGLKLAHALLELGLPVRARLCLDVGASSGGFTDCLLQHGAAAVTCVDVGYGELDWRLREDARVTVMERVNARYLDPRSLPYAPGLIVVDVSFISLSKVLPAVVAAGAPGCDVLALVKPQFELGRERVGKGGVVRRAADRLEALVAAGEVARRLGLAVRRYVSSGLPGPAGNRESFMWASQGGGDGVDNLVAAAREAEPETAA